MGLEGGVYVFKSGLHQADSERMLKGWGMLDENIARISTFVKEFLEFAKGRVPQVHLVSPNRIAQQVFGLFEHKAELAGITLRTNLQPDLPYALMDEDGIHTCLVNLVSNALDACEISDRPSRSVVLSTREEGGTLVFEVTDDGDRDGLRSEEACLHELFHHQRLGQGDGAWSFDYQEDSAGTWGSRFL